MINDIVDRLRAKWDFTSHYTRQDAVCVEAADEIERLRNMLAHGLVFGSTCEGCLICEQLKEVHEQTLREIALENQTNG